MARIVSLLPSVSVLSSLLLLLVLGQGVAAADPHPMAAGQQLTPAAAADPLDVAIAREKLTMKVLLDRVDVRAELVMQNRADVARVLDVGFPCDAGRREPSTSRLDCKTRVAIKIAGKKVGINLRRQRGKSEGDWTFAMRFAPKEEVLLVVEYSSKLVNDRYGVPFFGMSSITYRLTTGAQWAGPIGVLDMIAEIPVDTVTDIGPPGYTRAARRITWHLENHTPTEDVAITFAPYYNGAWYGNVTSKPKGGVETKGAGDLLDRFARDAGKDAVEFSKITERLFKLPPLSPERVARTVEESASLMRAELGAATTPPTGERR
jgi:hypothetical protein